MRREQTEAFAKLRISGTPMTVAPPLATCKAARPIRLKPAKPELPPASLQPLSFF